GLAGGGSFEFHAVSFPDAADLGVHQTGNAVFSRQNAEVRTHSPAGANTALERLKDRRRQGAAAVVDDRDGFVGNAVRQKLQHAIARSDVTRGSDQVLRVFDNVIADPPLLAP